jgi:hypothetical protein
MDEIRYEVGNVTVIVHDGRPSPFYQILAEAGDLHSRKNLNYAGPGMDPFKNFKECEGFGIPAWKGVLVRESDKWMRIKHLAQGMPDMVGESLYDTMLDLGNYAFIMAALLKESLATGDVE